MTVPKAIADDGLLSTAEVAKKLDVHRSTVWLWIKRGMLPSVKKGSFHGVKPTALEAFLSIYDIKSVKRSKRTARRKA